MPTVYISDEANNALMKIKDALQNGQHAHGIDIDFTLSQVVLYLANQSQFKPPSLRPVPGLRSS